MDSSRTDKPLGGHPLGGDASPILRRMQDSLKRRMFGGAPPSLGRFEVLDVLGRGGMGVVYRARDPKLDRVVAIKVVRPGSATTGERLASEARRLARLSHPNVVILHEVGDLEGEVFLVMELLGGGTLRDWLRAEPRHWRSIVRMMVDVGHGLTAAHDVGLVHRDFKPDNVLLGDDGRPRVVDFGLTREADDGQLDVEKTSADGPPTLTDAEATSRRFSGTPAYMAPEQHRGAATSHSDQYAFCVVLYEALIGRRPDAGESPEGKGSTTGRPPAGVMRAIRRGLSTNPRDRFESMPALLRALERGAQRRAWLLGATAALGTAGLVAYYGAQSPDEKQQARIAAEAKPCIEARRLVDRLRSLGETEKDEKLRERIEAYLDSGTDTIDGTCDAGPPDARANLVLACVQRRMLQLEALSALREDGSLGDTEALRVARQLPRPSACADPVRLAHQPPEPADPELAAAERALRDEVEHAGMIRLGGLDEQARVQLEETLAAAQSLPSLVAQAEAQLELARLHELAGHPEQALAGLRETIITAERASHGRCRASAQLELGGLLSNAGDFEGAQRELDRAEATIERVGNPPGLAARLAKTRGFVELRSGRFDIAVGHLRRSVAIDEATLGPNDFALIGSVNLLGAALGQSGEAEEAVATLERARDLVLRHHGPHHPLLGRILNNLGRAFLQNGEPKRGIEQLERALEINERNLGADHPSTLIAVNNLAQTQLSQGDLEAGQRTAERALAAAERVHGANNPELRWALSIAAQASARQGRYEEALMRLGRAERLITEAWGPDAVQFLDTGPGAIAVHILCEQPEAAAAHQAKLERILKTHDITPTPSLAAVLATKPE